MKPSTTKSSATRVSTRTILLLVCVTLIFPLLLVTSARVDERDDIIRDIESRLRDIRGYVSQLTGASSTGNVDYAIDKAESIKDKIRDLDRVKGDDSKASDMVSKYPGYVDKFKETMQSLKQIKEQQLAFRDSDQLRKCKDAEEKIQSKIADFRRTLPDDRDEDALRGDAEDIAGPIREFIIRSKAVTDTLKPLIGKVKDFNVTDGEWRDVSGEMSNSADRIYESWAKDVAEAREICNKVALGGRHVDLVKAAYGNCERPQLVDLRKKVKEFCKEGGSRSCDGNQLCPEVRERLRRNTECYKAREDVMKLCFDGGDAGHKEQLETTQRAIDKCNDRLKDCKESD